MEGMIIIILNQKKVNEAFGFCYCFFNGKMDKGGGRGRVEKEDIHIYLSFRMGRWHGNIKQACMQKRDAVRAIM